jgi:hypothetical protein
MLAALRWGEPFEVRIQIVWHEERWKSPALRAFLETARKVFSVVPTEPPEKTSKSGEKLLEAPFGSFPFLRTSENTSSRHFGR